MLARYGCEELRGTGLKFEVALNFSVWLRFRAAPAELQRFATSPAEAAAAAAAAAASRPPRAAGRSSASAATAAAYAAAGRLCPSLLPP